MRPQGIVTLVNLCNFCVKKSVRQQNSIVSSFTSSGKIQNAILSIVLVRVGGVEWGVQAGDNWVFTTIRIITDKPSPGQVSII